MKVSGIVRYVNLVLAGLGILVAGALSEDER